MEKQLSRIESKLDIVIADIAEIKTLDAVQNSQLSEHIRRTEALEKRVDSFWQKALVAVSILGGLATLAKLLLQ